MTEEELHRYLAQAIARGPGQVRLVGEARLRHAHFLGVRVHKHVKSVRRKA